MVACGKSGKQPFCDGSHKGPASRRMKFDADQSGTVSFCGCKASGNLPACDGSHKVALEVQSKGAPPARFLLFPVATGGPSPVPSTRKKHGPMTRADLPKRSSISSATRAGPGRTSATEIGGVSDVLIVGALLGQMKLVKPLARKAAALFGLSDAEERMLNEVPIAARRCRRPIR